MIKITRRESTAPRWRPEQFIVLAGLASLVVLAWVYLLHLTQQMPEMGLGITMSEAQSGQTTELAWTLVMWAVMMAAMMLPSAWPVVLAFVAINRRPRPLALAAVFLGGYLAVWIGFSALATLVHWLLHRQALLSPMLAIASAPVGGVILLAAGLFQWSSLKHACLAHCRSPLGFFLTDWREGVRGAFLMGLRYGGYCLGCCGPLMALLFVTGVMNLLWTAVIAVFILVEKAAPAGRWVGRIAGLLLIAWGLWLVACSPKPAEQRAQNCRYLQETLGGIVLDYQDRHGTFPETFEEAHQESGVTLPQRGDAFGQPLIYKKTGEDAFYFLAYGPNSQFDDGTGDDLKVEYQAGWLTHCSP